MASDSHAKRPIVVERRKEKGRKKTPRLTKTYDVKIIPATVGVVAETEEPPKSVSLHTVVSAQTRRRRKPVWKSKWHISTLL